MASFVRFLMRLLLVPLSAALAIVVAALVLVIAHWSDITALTKVRPDIDGYWLLIVAVVGPLTAVLLAIGVLFIVLPATVGVLISEAFAIRSWVFHIGNGGLSAWVGRWLLIDIPAEYHFLLEPRIIIAAGLAAGGAYWLVAGWSAGFWKPIYGPMAPQGPPQLPPQARPGVPPPVPVP
jgi:hypothetical protein